MAGEFGSTVIDPRVAEAQRAAESAAVPMGEFQGGLRSGALGMGSQLQSFAGGAARAAGMDTLAAGMEAGARETQASAQLSAPTFNSLRDVKGIGDFGNYAAGLAGGLIPSAGLALGAAALTGGGAVPAMLAGAAANTPFAAGDILQRQMLDPSTAGMGAGEKFGRALAGGAASSALEQAVPSIVGGKLFGSAARGAMKEGERGLLRAPRDFTGPMPQVTGPMPGVLPRPSGSLGAYGKAGLMDAGIEGLGEGVGEATRQVATGSDAPMDWQAVADNAIGGAIVGGPLGVAGHAADRFHTMPGGVQGLRDLASRGTEAVRGLADRGQAAVADAMPEMPGAPAEGKTFGEMSPREMVGAAGAKITAGVEKLGAMAGKVGDAFDKPVGETGAAVRQASVKAAADISSGLKRAMAGKPADINDPGLHGELTGLDDTERQELSDPATPPTRLAALAEKSTQAMQTWAQEKSQDDTLSPESQARFAAFAANPTDARAMAGALAEQGKITATKVKDATLGKVTGLVSRWNENKQGVKDWNAQRDAVENDVLARASAEGWSEERTDQEYRKAMDAVNDAAIADQDAIDAKRGGKKSQDYTAAERAIAQEIEPFLKGEFVGDRAARNKLSSLFRRIFSATGEGDLAKVEALAKELQPVFGDDTGEVMRRVYEKMGGEEMDGGAMYEHVGKVEQEGNRRAQLRETVRSLMPPAWQGGAREIDQLVTHLVDSVTGKTPDATHPGVKGHVDSTHKQIRNFFGEQADKVYDALDNYVMKGAEEEQMGMPGAKGAGLDSDESMGTEAEGADYEMMRNADEQNPTTTYHGGMLQDPERLRQRYPEGTTAAGKKVDNKAEKLLEALQKKYPSAMVEWVSERERTGDDSKREDVGQVRVTQRPDEGGFALDDYKHAKLETGKNARSEARIDVPLSEEQAQMLDVAKDKGAEGNTLKLDAVKLARRGMDVLKATRASEGETDAQRLARGFFEGMSQVMTDFEVRPKISPNTIIGYIGGKPFTVKDARGLDLRTGGDRASDEKTNQIVELNKALYGYEANGKKVEPTITEEKERAKAESDLKKLESGKEFKVGLEQGKDGSTTPLQDVETRLRAAVSQIAELTASGSKDAERAREAVEALGGATKHRPATRKMGDNETQMDRGGRRFAPDDESARTLASALSGLNLNPDKKLTKSEQESFDRLNSQIKRLREQHDALTASERFKAEYTTEGAQGRTELAPDENIHVTQALKGGAADAEGVLPGATPEGDKKAAMKGAASVSDTRSTIAVQGQRGELRGRAGNVNHWVDAAGTLSEASASGKVTGPKLMALAKNVDAMSKQDKQALENALGGGEVTPSNANPTINRLYEKYSPNFTQEQRPISDKMQKLLDAGDTVQEKDGTFVVDDAGATPHIAGTLPSGEVYVNVGKLGSGADARANLTSYLEDSEQKSAVLERLGVDAGQLAGLFKNKREMVDFLKRHEQSHVNAEDSRSYPKGADGKPDLMHPRALDIEQRATLDALTDKQRAALDMMGGTPRPKALAAKKAALDKAATSSDPALVQELSTADDIGAVARTAAYLNEAHPDSAAAQAAADRFDTLAQDEDAAYSQLTAKESRAKVTPGQGKSSVFARGEAEQYIADVLGPKVAVMWKNMMHAGEFVVDNIGPVIKLSVHVLNPRSVAYHESLHAFFDMLHKAGAHNVVRAVEKAASQQHVKAWMENYYKGQPDVLKQLATSAEERAAYMYQLYFNEPGFRSVLNPQATTVFQRIGRFINSVLGLWSNDERAIAIMEHFQSGAYAQGIGTANVNTVMNPGTNKAVEAFNEAVAPLKKMWDALMTTGNARLRDMGIDAVTQIADLVHIPVAGKGAAGNTGWVAAARTEAVTRINHLANNIGAASPEAMADALEGLQFQRPAKTAEGKRIQNVVYDALQEMGGSGASYMRGAGLQFGDLGADYFPRVWDSSVIAANPKAFEAMLDKYAQKGFKLDPKEITQRLLTNDGNNFDVDTRTPGMQNLKERSLDFISPDDADAWVSKDLYGTMTSYITQASRRTEWAKRFGAKGERLHELMNEAKTQGATPDQIQTIDKYVKGVTGTLGDGINPTARRWIGNALVYQNIRLLPLAIFSSIVDPMGIALRGGSVGDAFTAFKQGVKDIPRNFKKGGMNTQGINEEIAQTLGVIENAGIMHALGSIHTQGMVSEFGRKVNDTFFRFNMMEQWNRTMRTAATETAQRFIMRHEGGVDAHSARFIKELGLEPGDVQTVMVPGNTGKLEPRMKLFESDGLTPQQAERVRDAINKWVDGAVLRPNTADKPVYFNDPHFALITHLKQFTFSFQQTIINRVIDEAKMGNYRPAAMIASYVPISIAADFMKGMVQGGGEQPAWKKAWGPTDYVWSGVQRAGLMGTGQVGVDASSNVERSGVGGAVTGFFGPTIEQMVDGVQVAAGNKRFAPYVVDAMPANALYKPYVGTSPSL